jgi:hypothetical protein
VCVWGGGGTYQLKLKLSCVPHIPGTSLIIKIFLFQFVNTNAALVYIAVIKPLWFEIYGLDKGERACAMMSE